MSTMRLPDRPHVWLHRRLRQRDHDRYHVHPMRRLSLSGRGGHLSEDEVHEAWLDGWASAVERASDAPTVRENAWLDYDRSRERPAWAGEAERDARWLREVSRLAGLVGDAQDILTVAGAPDGSLPERVRALADLASHSTMDGRAGA